MTLGEFKKLPISEFTFRSEMIEEERVEREKELMRAACFVAWQTQPRLEVKASWEKYQIAMGVLDKPEPIPEEIKKVQAEKAYSFAEKIAEADRKRQNARTL